MRIVLFFIALILVPIALADCPVILSARDTEAFITAIPDVHSQLQGCPVSLPTGTGFLLSNGEAILDIIRPSGTVSTTVLVKEKQIVGLQAGGTTCKQRVIIHEPDLDEILQNEGRADAFMKAYDAKKVDVKGCTFVRKLVTAISTPIIRLFI